MDIIGEYVELKKGTWAYIVADGDARIHIAEDGCLYMTFTKFTCGIIYMGCLDLENVTMPPEDTDEHNDFPWEIWAINICDAIFEQGI